MLNVANVHPIDPAGHVPSGIDAFIRSILKFAPPDIHYTLYGATSDPVARLPGKLAKVVLGEREIEYWPLVTMDARAQRDSWRLPSATCTPCVGHASPSMLRMAPRDWRYHVIIAYYHRNGYWLGMLRGHVRRSARSKWVSVGFAPNPPISGLRGWVKEFLTRNALTSFDVIICNARPSR